MVQGLLDRNPVACEAHKGFGMSLVGQSRCYVCEHAEVALEVVGILAEIEEEFFRR